jgi:probable HAF family extracellular repeat protein
MNVLGTLGGDYSIAHDINNHGQLVGESRAPDGNTYAFLADAAGGAWTSLGSLPGGSGSRAYAINDAGQVVGEAGAPDGAHAFLWDSVNGMQDLGALPGGFMDDARGYDINEFGSVVGESAADGNVHAFLSQAGMMTDLDDLMTDAGWDVLWQAHGINEAGQIVGYGYNDGNYGFLLTPQSEPVPEPASLVFFATGLVGVAGLVTRRRMRRAV